MHIYAIHNITGTVPYHEVALPAYQVGYLGFLGWDHMDIVSVSYMDSPYKVQWHARLKSHWFFVIWKDYIRHNFFSEFIF